MGTRISAKATIEGRRESKTQWGDKRFYTWLRIPDVFPNRCLTMVATDEEFLPHGTRTADAILVEVDPDSLYQHSSGFAADVKVIDVWEDPGPSEADGGQEKEAEG